MDRQKFSVDQLRCRKPSNLPPDEDGGNFERSFKASPAIRQSSATELFLSINQGPKKAFDFGKKVNERRDGAEAVLLPSLRRLSLYNGEESDEECDCNTSPLMSARGTLTSLQGSASAALPLARGPLACNLRGCRQLREDRQLSPSLVLDRVAILPPASPPSNVTTFRRTMGSLHDRHLRSGCENVELPLVVVDRLGTRTHKRSRRSSGSSEDEEIVASLAGAPPLGAALATASGVTRPHTPNQLTADSVCHVNGLLKPSLDQDLISCSAPCVHGVSTRSAKKRSCPDLDACFQPIPTAVGGDTNSQREASLLERRQRLCGVVRPHLSRHNSYITASLLELREMSRRHRQMTTKRFLQYRNRRPPAAAVIQGQHLLDAFDLRKPLTQRSPDGETMGYHVVVPSPAPQQAMSPQFQAC